MLDGFLLSTCYRASSFLCARLFVCTYLPAQVSYVSVVQSRALDSTPGVAACYLRPVLLWIGKEGSVLLLVHAQAHSPCVQLLIMLVRIHPPPLQLGKGWPLPWNSECKTPSRMASAGVIVEHKTRIVHKQRCILHPFSTPRTI